MNHFVEIAGTDRPLTGAGEAAWNRPNRTSDIGLLGIYEISKLLNEPARLETVLASVANVLSSFLQMQFSMIVILDEAGDPEIVATADGAGDSTERRVDFLPQAVIDQLVATQTPVVVQNIASDPLFAEVSERITAGLSGRVSFLGVPIKAGDKVVGTLSIDRVRDGTMTFRIDEDLRFLKMVANLIGQSVRLHRILSADRQRLLDERSALEKALTQELADKGHLPTPKKIGGIVGESDRIRKVMQTIATVAKSNSTVLLRGESGTGKELFARAIHDMSERKSKPFVKLNCAALPESVLESELFGHEKGAFTGAVSQRQGRFEMANSGTLLLDEIGEISASFQAKLLRVLQEGEFERVGGNKTLKVDVRLVCATNKDLETAVSKGEFRADLYYRINVVPVFLPPLRDRPGDVRLLARNFLDRFNKENGRKLDFSGMALNVLERCYFPGNVRELENCVRRTATLARGGTIDRGDFACASGDCLSALLWTGSGRRNPAELTAVAPASVLAPAVPETGTSCAGSEFELPVGPAQSCGHAGVGDCPAIAGGRPADRDRLIEAMERSGWVQAKAARLLGLTPRQIGYALKKQGIELKHI
ncbi:nif-specific transcriptional activator NifA [Roseibium litorale]|uniref:Nif-specific regulatory protein n=1 Tax=Roseibium litorale TaxID=2803841 RepID=A0ABR9CRK1_9HYPH|nr:nif-specific transcriptional activator NifA [Roseibium litorale]MBD8893308.1 nif-specific transcriptional activator NifA [Roseibium litorale]